MKAKKAALFAAVSIAYFLILRTLGTLFPVLFNNLTAVYTVSILSFLASLPMLLFVVYFYNEYVQKNQQRLKSAAGWAVFGNSLVVFMYARVLIINLRMNFLPDILKSRFMEMLMPFIPLVSALLLFIFFLFYLKEAATEDKTNLRKALMYAVFGASAALFIRTVIIVMYLCNENIRWFSELSGPLAYIGLPVFLLSALAGIYFFSSFHRGRDLF